MTLDPVAQFTLALAAFLGGIAFGLLGEIGKIARILLGAYLPPVSWQARYERPLPLVSRPPRFRKNAPRRAWATAVSFCMDLAFPILAALYLLYLLFRFNNGVLRVSALVLFLLGLAAFRVTLARYFLTPLAMLAFLFCALGVYVKALLLLPLKLFARAITRVALRPLSLVIRTLEAKMNAWHTTRMCALQLELAGGGLLPKKKRNLKLCRKKEKRVVASSPSHW